MIEIQRLLPSDFKLLEKFADGYATDPKHSVAIVARNSVGIIGRIFIVSPAHVEGVFIEKAWRNGPVFKMLMDGAELEARSEGITQLLAYAKDEQIADYVERLGYIKMPFTVWSKQLKCLSI